MLRFLILPEKTAILFYLFVSNKNTCHSCAWRVRYTYGVDIYPPPLPLKGWVELETLGRVVEELFPISLVFLFLSTVHDLLCVYMHYPLNTIIFFFLPYSNGSCLDWRRGARGKDWDHWSDAYTNN